MWCTYVLPVYYMGKVHHLLNASSCKGPLVGCCKAVRAQHSTDSPMVDNLAKKENKQAINQPSQQATGAVVFTCIDVVGLVGCHH
jgi:hypothetical protein